MYPTRFFQSAAIFAVTFILLGHSRSASAGKREPVNSTLQVNALAYSADGKRLVFGRQDGSVEIWDGQTLRWISSQTCEESISSVAMNSKGEQFAIACANDASTLFTFKRVGNAYVSDKKLQYKTMPNESALDHFDAVAYSPDDKWLACASMCKIRILDTNEHKLRKMLYELGNGVSEVMFSHDGSRLFTAGQTLRAWDLKLADIKPDVEDSENLSQRDLELRQQKLTAFKLGSWAVAGAVASDKLGVFGAGTFDAADKGRPIRVMQFDYYYGRTIRTFAKGSANLTCLAVAPDKQFLAAGDDTGAIRIWRVDNGNLLRTLKPNVGLIRSISFDPEGKGLMIAADKMYPELWDHQTGQMKRRLSR